MKILIKKVLIGFASLFVLFFLAAIIFGESSNPLSKVENDEQLLSLINEIKSDAQLDNSSIKRCGDKCKGKTVYAELAEPILSSTKFDGDSKNSKTLKANGIEFKPLNAEFNDDGISINLGFKRIELDKIQLRSSTFSISGKFIENHYLNDDVKGYILSVSTDKNKVDALIADKIESDKRKAEQEKAYLAKKLEREKQNKEKEKLASLVSELSDGEHKYYGLGHRDNTISSKKAEALCSKAFSVPRKALVTNTLGASRAIRHIANNGGAVTKTRIFWDSKSNQCLVGYKVSGLYKGTNYARSFVGKAAVFVKSPSSVSIKYIQ